MQSSTTVCILSTVAECSGCVVRSGGVPVAAPTARSCRPTQVLPDSVVFLFAAAERTPGGRIGIRNRRPLRDKLGEGESEAPRPPFPAPAR